MDGGVGMTKRKDFSAGEEFANRGGRTSVFAVVDCEALELFDSTCRHCLSVFLCRRFGVYVTCVQCSGKDSTVMGFVKIVFRCFGLDNGLDSTLDSLNSPFSHVAAICY